MCYCRYVRTCLSQPPHQTSANYTTSLHSSSMQLLHKPTTRTHFADRTFLCTEPSVCNSLNTHIVDSGSLSVFKSRLKAFLILPDIYSEFATVCQHH